MIRRQLQLCALAGLVGFAAALAAYVLEARALLLGYLCVAVTVAAIPAGALAVLLMTYLVRGAWSENLHVPLVSAALLAPLAGILFLPVLLNLSWIYPWAQHSTGTPGSLKAIYLAPAFFTARTIVYFAIWTVLALWARRAWGDRSRMTAVASAGLILYALSASFAGIDWLESRTPEFHSSIYGLLFLTFQLLAGFSFALVVALCRRDSSTNSYGAILFAALLLWSYNHAMQYLIIWSGDIPNEVVWYTRREGGAWALALWSLMTLQFIIPFFVMLADRMRNARWALIALASATVSLRLLEAVILALPGTECNAWTIALAIGAVLLLLGSVFWYAFSMVLRILEVSRHDIQPLWVDRRACLEPIQQRS